MDEAKDARRIAHNAALQEFRYGPKTAAGMDGRQGVAFTRGALWACAVLGPPALAGVIWASGWLFTVSSTVLMGLILAMVAIGFDHEDRGYPLETDP